VRNTKTSKLELYVEILRSLEKQELTRLSDIEQKIGMGTQAVRQAMAFLEKQNFVEKLSVDNRIVYKSTPRGERVTKYFSQHDQEGNYLIPDNATYPSTASP
jgi:predicted transcriptional regulator